MITQGSLATSRRPAGLGGPARHPAARSARQKATQLRQHSLHFEPNSPP